MAVKNATFTDISQDGSVRLYTWTLDTGDTGAPIDQIEFGDRCVQFLGGTWGGSTAVWEGSMDGATYGTLNNAQGTGLSFTADVGPKQVVEIPRYSRPKVSGGTGSGIICYLVARRSNTMRT